MDKLLTPISSEQALETVGRHTDDGLFVDVLWDQVAHPDLLYEFCSEDRGQYIALFLGSPFEHIVSRSPFLWRVNKQSDHFLQRLILEKEPQITLFISMAPFLLQKCHLQSLLEAYLPDGNCTHLRMYNDLVFRRLLNGCTAEDVVRILGPNAAAMYPSEPEAVNNREAQWLLADNPDNTAPLHLVDTYILRESPWFKLRDEHFTEFADAMHLTLIDNIVQDLWYRDTPHAAHINRKYETIEKFTDNCVQEGQTFGLETYEDLQAYAFLLAEFEAVSGRKEIASAVMTSDAAPSARMATLRNAFEGRTK